MILFQSWLLAIPQLLPAVGLSVAFAFCAWGVRAVTGAAALTGVLLTIVLCLAAGPGGLFPIMVVFLITYLTTRIGRRKKERLGTAERRHGRGPLQILANVGVAALCAAPLVFVGHARHILLAGASAALAEAAGDTVSSELGQAFGGRPRLITTLRPVTPGQDGGITTAGTIFSLCALPVVRSSRPPLFLDRLRRRILRNHPRQPPRSHPRTPRPPRQQRSQLHQHRIRRRPRHRRPLRPALELSSFLDLSLCLELSLA